MISAVLVLFVLGAASALPQFGAPQAALISRTEQVDHTGQYSRSHALSDGTSVQEVGRLEPNNQNDGHVLTKSGSYRHFTPEGREVFVDWVADKYGFHILNSNAVPVAPAPVPPTF